MHNLFVYGTLKSGYWNNRLLVGSQLVGEAVTVDDFLLTDCGFPFCIKEKVKGIDYLPVVGELWSITDIMLEGCDRLEGHPTFYCREKRNVVLTSTGEVYNSWIYIHEPTNLNNICPVVDGNYEWGRGVV